MGGAKRDVDRALIPTGHGAPAYTCLRSLASRGVGAVIASEKEGVPAAASRFCDESVSLPSPRDDVGTYRDALLDLARRADVKTVVPTRPEDAYMLSRYRDEFAEHVSNLVPTYGTYESINDQLRLAEVAEEAGVPVPETRSLHDVEDWEQELIVKSRYNLLTSDVVESYEHGGCGVVKDIRYLGPGIKLDHEEVVEAMGHVPIVQEYVPKDEEYVFAALYDHGEPLATFQHLQVRGRSYLGGGGAYRKSVSLPELDRVGRALLDHLEWHGLACIEYMRHAETGELVLTEVNPRMWMSLPAAVRAGANFPYHYWLAANGRTSEIDPVYDLDVGRHQLYGEFTHLASILKEDSALVSRPSLTRRARAILTSMILDPHFDYLRLDDPGPFIRGLTISSPFGDRHEASPAESIGTVTDADSGSDANERL